MVGRKEIAFSVSLIEKAEARVAYQLKIVDSLPPDTDPHIVNAGRNLLDLTSKRATLLKARHQTSLAAAAAEEMLDEQTNLVSTMVVGDARKPEARRLLDQMHDNASAGRPS